MRKRPLAQEGFDRNGHWSREFSLRGEGWTVIEHWAGEYGFGLVHLKGKRRVYRKGDNAKFLVAYVEFRLDEEENRLHVSAWIEAGSLIRFFSLWSIPSVLDLSPQGFWGIRTKRRVCHAVNSLLYRMKQPTILGSEGLHWADLDATTIALGVASVAFAVPFFAFGSSWVSIAPGLSNNLVQILLRYAGFLSAAMVVLCLVQQLFVSKRWPEGPIRFLSALGMAVALLVTTIFLFTKTRTEIRDSKLSYYCIHTFDTNRCDWVLDGLSEAERIELLGKVFELEESLVKRDKLRQKRNDR